jgi:hypothetical protein
MGCAIRVEVTKDLRRIRVGVRANDSTGELIAGEFQAVEVA